MTSVSPLQVASTEDQPITANVVRTASERHREVRRRADPPRRFVVCTARVTENCSVVMCQYHHSEPPDAGSTRWRFIAPPWQPSLHPPLPSPIRVGPRAPAPHTIVRHLGQLRSKYRSATPAVPWRPKLPLARLMHIRRPVTAARRRPLN